MKYAICVVYYTTIRWYSDILMTITNLLPAHLRYRGDVMNRSVAGRIVIAAALCGLLGLPAYADSISSTTPTRPSTNDSVTGTDPVPISPHVIGVIVTIMQAFM